MDAKRKVDGGDAADLDDADRAAKRIKVPVSCASFDDFVPLPSLKRREL
jgi:hypothetical protein